MHTDRQQFGVQRKTRAQLAYFRNANNADFVPILEYRPLTRPQIKALEDTYYKDGHMVGFKKLFEAVRANWASAGVHPTRVQVQAWLDTQELVQRYKPIRNQKLHQPIRVKAPLDRLQIDILDMGTRNMFNGRKYILNAIDIFTRKAWAETIHTPGILVLLRGSAETRLLKS